MYGFIIKCLLAVQILTERRHREAKMPFRLMAYYSLQIYLKATKRDVSVPFFLNDEESVTFMPGSTSYSASLVDYANWFRKMRKREF